MLKLKSGIDIIRQTTSFVTICDYAFHDYFNFTHACFQAHDKDESELRILIAYIIIFDY